MLIRLDWNGLLSEVTNGSGFVVEYMHDIMDRVTNISWRTTSGAAIGGFQYEYDAAGRIVSRSHPIGVGDRLASYGRARSPSAPQYVVGACTYDAWGNVVDEEITTSASVLSNIRYRFQCREWSVATGLINFRMRWYDPETGRWLSKDPIGLRGGLNLYAFCQNCPSIFRDPSGQISVEEIRVLIAAFGEGFVEAINDGE